MNTISDTPVIDKAGAIARPIGDILVSTGRLSAEDAQRILARQKQDNSQFGDAALALKLLKREDIDFALSKQFDYSYLVETDTSRSPELVAAYKPFSRIGESLRAVRSQLMLRWFNNETAQKAVAMVSPGASEGRSFIAANLAIVFSQQGQRTLLIDADLRKSRQQTLFGLGKSAGLSGILADRAGLEAALPVQGMDNLMVLPAGAVPPNPQELLGRPAFANLLKAAAENFDVVIIDTPAGTAYADAEIIASAAGAAVLVTRKDQTRISEAKLLSRRLQDGGVILVGSILNDN
jgi:protein-tyrosine kinase